jgi:hypothetical protein
MQHRQTCLPQHSGTATNLSCDAQTSRAKAVTRCGAGIISHVGVAPGPPVYRVSRIAARNGNW